MAPNALYFSHHNAYYDDHTRQVQPVLLEVNYSPDAGEILKSCPEFYYHVFDTLYADTPHSQFKQLGSASSHVANKSTNCVNGLPPNLGMLLGSFK